MSVLEVPIVEPNTCTRGCCQSDKIPLVLHSPSSFSISPSPIARGTESFVYEGYLGGKRIAIKKPILSTSQDIDKFHRELQLLCKLDHPAIAKLLGAHARPPNYMFFFELFEHGNLSEKLHVEEWSPGMDKSLAIISQLAQALLYLHNLGIVHRDIKPGNILLDENLHPKLSDFGLADYIENLKQPAPGTGTSSGKPTGGFHKKNMVGTLIYMAPEILKKEVHTEKTDVYSYAVTINELLTGVVPYTDLRTEAQPHTVVEMSYTEQQLTAAVASEGLRPIVAGPELGVPETLSSLIQKCWDPNPIRRPSFGDIVSDLGSICDEVKSSQKVEESAAQSTASVDRPISRSDKSQVEGISWSNQGKIEASKIVCLTEYERIWRDNLGHKSEYLPVLSWGSFSTCGHRETMEDTHFLMPRMHGDHIHLFGIFDGHRGAAAAEFSAQAFPKFLESFSSASPKDALVNAFVKTDTTFRELHDSSWKVKGFAQKDWHPGCTAITTLLIKDTVYVANSGDCRAILCRKGHAIALSRDHVASCPEERERVIKAGGLVKFQVDDWRVGSAALQVTRSIGDDDLKPAVTAEPEITVTNLSAEDEYLVMASDGLWDSVTNEEVVRIIRATVKEPGMCSKRLATEAAERGSKDNITVIVVFLCPVTTAERIY